ncbi:unnamed protein product, partial [Symbiodinium pilosum]
LTARASAVASELLNYVGLQPFLETPPRAAAQLILEASLRFHLTLLEIEPLILPPWVMDMAFPSREMFFASLDLESSFQQWPP